MLWPEVQVADLLNTSSPDVRCFDGDELLWEVVLPDDLQWTSVITVSNTHLIGTATRFTDSGERLFTLELPSTAHSEVIVLNRHTGEVVHRSPITDDATSTVTIGPDGSLYVTMLSLLHTLSLDTRPVGGVIRFAPSE
jgi:outer membrane protein assembly factor BamB